EEIDPAIGSQPAFGNIAALSGLPAAGLRFGSVGAKSLDGEGKLAQQDALDLLGGVEIGTGDTGPADRRLDESTVGRRHKLQGPEAAATAVRPGRLSSNEYPQAVGHRHGRDSAADVLDRRRRGAVPGCQKRRAGCRPKGWRGVAGKTWVLLAK